MNSITDLINDKADELFTSQTSNPTNSNNDFIDLENYSDIKVNENISAEIIISEPAQNNTNDIHQEVVEVNNIVPSTPQENSIDIEALKSKIYSIKDQLEAIIRLIEHGKQNLSAESIIIAPKASQKATKNNDRIVEGIFDGEKMIGEDGKEYSIPPNYASKSKLVEGDILKLTITSYGRFIYKQINPIDRSRKIGKLAKDAATDQWYVIENDKKYKVLNASVTFYKGKPGDEAIFIIASNIPNSWAAIDNIIKQK